MTLFDFEPNASDATSQATFAATKITQGVDGVMFHDFPRPSSPTRHHHISISEQADQLACEYAETSNAKLVVLKAFYEAFEQTSKMFTSEPERAVIQPFADNFMTFWKQALSGTESTSVTVKRKPSASLEGTSSPGQHRNKNTAGEFFQQLIESVRPSTMIVRVDFSPIGWDGQTTYDFTIYQDRRVIVCCIDQPCQDDGTEAEAMGALAGLKAALDRREACTQEIIVCLRESTVARVLQSSVLQLPQVPFLELRTLALDHGAKIIRIAGQNNDKGSEQANEAEKIRPESIDISQWYTRNRTQGSNKDDGWTQSINEEYRSLDPIDRGGFSFV
ncbi:hypothetical protein VFPPC_15012 [Pochonia chlamydosporia 170]|uniref:Uncharacterized protein n=1 Tax=Pochonia chlamydosporia 170 TaxID=1380566 RepID=A0A179EZ49_METCM|nr:hypothetical protein VFPPC_15012 [Pochonia chlamydosporia 170]OAQ58280.1 hypothetical protein VFPPC_15012 [Pochonia chlamydosporia 170]